MNAAVEQLRSATEAASERIPAPAPSRMSIYSDGGGGASDAPHCPAPPLGLPLPESVLHPVEAADKYTAGGGSFEVGRG
jgi:hypothetical protein